MSKLIPLTRDKFSIVDDEDYESLSKTKWQCTSDGRAAAHYNVKGKTRRVYMARLITDCPADKVVDHINRDRLDNRRCNLRICSRQENNRNRILNVPKTSRFMGVHFRKSRKSGKRWCAYIWHGKHEFIGYYLTEEEAARARDQKALEYFGDFAVLNFPKNRQASFKRHAPTP